MIAIYNHSDTEVVITKGTRVAQGIFYQFLTVDKDEYSDVARDGGFGSTGI